MTAWDGMGLAIGNVKGALHGVANAFDTIRHGLADSAHSWAATFDGLRHAAATAAHNVAHAFDNVRHDIAAKFDGIKAAVVGKFAGRGRLAALSGQGDHPGPDKRDRVDARPAGGRR